MGRAMGMGGEAHGPGGFGAVGGAGGVGKEFGADDEAY